MVELSRAKSGTWIRVGGIALVSLLAGFAIGWTRWLRMPQMISIHSVTNLEGRDPFIHEAPVLLIPGTPLQGVEKLLGKADFVDDDGTMWYLSKKGRQTNTDLGPSLLRVRMTTTSVRDTVVLASFVKAKGPTPDDIVKFQETQKDVSRRRTK